VALETVNSSPAINQACRQAYQRIQQVFSVRLCNAGLSESQADSLALVCVAAIEGATLLSRTLHSAQPLHEAAVFLEHQIRLFLKSSNGG